MRHWKSTCVLIMAIHMVCVVTGCAARTDVSLDQTQPLTRAQIYEILTTTLIEVDFDGVTLEEALRQIEAAAGVDFVLLWDDPYDDGFNPDAVITLVLDRQVTISDAIKLALEVAIDPARHGRLEGTWQLGSSWVEVGSLERLNRIRSNIAIPVDLFVMRSPLYEGMSDDDLEIWLNAWAHARDESYSESERRYSDGEAVDDIIDLIQSAVHPFQWEENGGEGGSIRYFNGVLVLSAADYLVRDIGGYHFNETILPDE